MLTLFHRIKPMLVMVNALLFAVPQVATLILMAFLVVLAFAVIGVSLFGNGFGQCLDAEDTLQDYEDETNPNPTLTLTLTLTQP